MAGRGPAPKPAHKRARSNVDPIGTRVIPFPGRAKQPELPDDIDWHPRTVAWWRTWDESPLSANFTDDDWSFLIDTALMHTAFWSKGQWTLAAEVRLRVAKYGQTPEDRARLRIVFADADEKDEKRTTRASKRATAGPAQYARLKAVD